MRFSTLRDMMLASTLVSVMAFAATAQQPEATGRVGQGTMAAPNQAIPENVPKASTQPPQYYHPQQRPQNNLSESEYKAMKEKAAKMPPPNVGSSSAPEPLVPADPQVNNDDNGAFTPAVFSGIVGQDEDLFCSGVAPSDMALAVNANRVVQVVNNCISIYDKTTGTILAGYPKLLNTFLGLPNDNRANNQFISDPRALYDYVANRWVVIAIYLDFANSRGFLGLAASQTSDPNGAWFIYPPQQIGTTGQCPDFPTLGQTFFGDPFVGGINIGFNLFTCDPNGFHNFSNDVVLFYPKRPVYAGQGFGFNFAFNLNVGGVHVDTVQPVNVQDFSQKPRVAYAVNSFNINFGNGQCRNPCNGLVVWAFANTLQQAGSPGLVISAKVIATPSNYVIPAAADEPGADNFVDTNDTRISGTVQYANGYLYPTINTGNGGTSAVLGWKIQPFLNDNGDNHCTGTFTGACPTISAATVVEEFCYACGVGHGGGAYYGTIQPDPEGNWTMGFTFSSRTLSPGIAYTSNRVSWATPFHDSGIYLCQLNVPYTGGFDLHRWGDYTATAPDLLNPDGTPNAFPGLWFAGMFVKTNGHWGTCIGANTFSLATQNGD